MSDTRAAHDPDTLAFYDREAKNYAAWPKRSRNPWLEQFLASLATGAKIL